MRYQQSSSPYFEIIDRTQTGAELNDFVVSYCEDCACATIEQIFVPPLIYGKTMPEESYCAVPDLRLEPLADQAHWAVFNPTGEVGILVLNRDAIELLAKFNAPTTLFEVLQQYAGYSGEVEKVVGRLLAVGLILPVGQTQAPTSGKSHLLTVWLHLTNQCSLDCTYCYLAKTDEHLDEATGRAAIDAVIRSAITGRYQAVKLKYAGGEASLRMATLLHLHDYAERECQKHNLGLTAVLLTNGVHLQADDIDELKQRQIAVMVSLDSVDEVHDWQRPFRGGQGSVKKVLAGIERLTASNLLPHLSITVTDHNAAKIADIVRFALARELTFSINFYRDNAFAVTHTDLKLSEDKIIAGMQKAFEAIAQDIPRWSVVGAILDRGQLVSPHEYACGVGRDYIVIDHKGQILKCHMEMDKPVTTVNHPYPLEMIRLSSIGVQNPSSLTKEGCRDCEWRFYCTGGCPTATYKATGRYDVESPNCNIYKSVFPLAVRLEGMRLLRYAHN